MTHSAAAQRIVRRTLRNASVALALAFVSILSTPHLPAAGARFAELDQLMSRAQERGGLRVFVGFQMSEYSALVQQANAIRVPSATIDAQGEAERADLQLASAIQSAAASVLSRLGRQNYSLLHIYTTIPFMVIEATPESLLELADLPEVNYLAEDHRNAPEVDGRPRLGSDDTNPKTPMLTDSTRIIGADQAWLAGIDGKGWYVAVLDTGIRKTHEMFQGKTIVEQCYSANRDCPNGQTAMSGDGAAAHYESTYSGYDHGSHVSGIAAGNSHLNAFGVARGANIISVQVFSRFSAADCSRSTPCVMSWDSDQVKGLEFVYGKRATIPIAAVNMSLGGGEYATFCNAEPQKAAIANLLAAGIATVISSGNDGFCNAISAPACIGDAVAVGATSKSDVEANFSNWQPNLVDLFAPGVSITSSTGARDDSYAAWNGTSMAAPHVTGTFAVLRQIAPTTPLSELLNTLTITGLTISSRCGTGQKPRIAVFAALERMATVKPPLLFSGQQHENRSALQVEYLNQLTWQANPLNQNIVAYRLYRVVNGELQLLAELSAGTTSYMHRFVETRRLYDYAVRAVNNAGIEGLAASVSVQPIM